MQLQDVALTKTALKQTKKEANLTFVIFESRELKLIDCLCLYFSVLFSESPNSRGGGLNPGLNPPLALTPSNTVSDCKFKGLLTCQILNENALQKPIIQNTAQWGENPLVV